MKILKPILVFICFLSLITVTAGNESDSVKNSRIINYSNLEFTFEGDLESVVFSSATCSEIRGGVKFTTTVNCFLCGEGRSQARCQRVLSRRLNSLNPVNNF